MMPIIHPHQHCTCFYWSMSPAWRPWLLAGTGPSLNPSPWHSKIFRLCFHFPRTLPPLVLPLQHRESLLGSKPTNPGLQTCYHPLPYHFPPSTSQPPFQALDPLYPLTTELTQAELVSSFSLVWRSNCGRNVMYEGLAVVSMQCQEINFNSYICHKGFVLSFCHHGPDPERDPLTAKNGARREPMWTVRSTVLVSYQHTLGLPEQACPHQPRGCRVPPF